MSTDHDGNPIDGAKDARDARDATTPDVFPHGHKPRKRFKRGKEKPRGVSWFGVQSFWGHLRHLAAVAIATEDVDSRFWMTPDEPEELLQRICHRLGAGSSKPTLTENLGRDLWIDYVADTGDAVAVSRAVAKMLFRPYQLPDPDRPGATLLAPRGDLLLFGGDTAYPVATAEEITNRVLVPFNQVLEGRPKDHERVLLGIPGNHDWYDGLDGFGRMFRQRDPGAATTGPPTSRQSTTLIGRYATYAREFVRGGQIEKPEVLELSGYTPVQNASYFVLPLAPGTGLLAVDRQLRRVNHQQQDFFARYLNSNLALKPWIALPDPVYAFGEKSRTGFEMLAALGLRLQGRPQFFLSGDIHHYRREHKGAQLFVTAGGGGAFLHPAAMRNAEIRAEVEWPDRAQSRVLLRQVPLKVAAGRSGILPHAVLLVLLAPIFVSGLGAQSWLGPFLMTPLAVAMAVGFGFVLIGSGSGGGKGASWLAVPAALCTVGIAVLAVVVAQRAFVALPSAAAAWLTVAGLLVSSVFLGVFLFGAYLALLTRFGWESTQAFTALDHPGYKHFMRFRVRADGSAVDAYCVGMVDPLASDAEPVVVDHFTWRLDETSARTS